MAPCRDTFELGVMVTLHSNPYIRAESKNRSQIAALAIAVAVVSSSGCHRPHITLAADLGVPGEWTIYSPGEYLLHDRGRPYEFDGVVTAFFSEHGVTVGIEGEQGIVAFGPGRMPVWRAALAGSAQIASLASVEPQGNATVVLDGFSERILTYDGEGELKGSIVIDLPFGATGDTLELHKALPLIDGTFVLFADRSKSRDVPLGVSRGGAQLIHIAPDGAFIRTLARMAGEEIFRTAAPAMVGTLPFGRRTLVGTDGTALYVADGTTFGVTAISADGDTIRQFERSAVRPSSFTTADQREYRRLLLNHFAPDHKEPALRAHLEELPLPSEYPYHRALIVTEDGHIWLEEFPARQSKQVTWHVFDIQGRPVARLTHAASVRIIAASADRVLAVQTMSYGAQRLSVHRIDRGGAP